MRAAFNRPASSFCIDTSDNEVSKEDTASIVGDVLFEGASDMIDVARMAQNPPLRRTQSLDSRTRSLRHVINTQVNEVHAGNCLHGPCSRAQRRSRRLDEMSMASLAQPSMHPERRNIPNRRGTETQTITQPLQPEPALGGGDDDQTANQSASSPLQSLPASAVIPPEESASKSLTKEPGLGPRPSVPEAMNAQILGSSPPEPASAKATLSSTPSTRHLASGGSTNDTFGAWRRRQIATPENHDIVIGGIEGLSDPFMQQAPESLPQPAAEEDAETSRTQAERNDGAGHDEGTPSNARWSDEYDQFSSDGQQRRLTQVSPGHYELLERGYVLKTPPVLSHRIPPVYRWRADDSSDEGELPRVPIPEANEQQGIPQQHGSPQPVMTMVPLIDVTNEARLAVDNLAERVNRLTVESHTHFWNAGVFAGRLAARDRELQSAMLDVASRDEMIRRLCDRVVARDAEIERLRGEQPLSTQNHHEDENESWEGSDMYGVSADGANNRHEQKDSEKQTIGTEGDEEVEEEEEEDEVLLSPAPENRRHRLRLDSLETATDSALLELRGIAAIRQFDPLFSA
ncbi:hypothetical protein H2200_011561 [Cladophialophora chaetospira]|uniref:Uncharacterized protein n=1 Tax=Cladophialophora chaetospira TaxID=386627 RepID=A0AA38WZL1_9EURO|nr:hypothetical protein H2200_011561 [Cladophialophora chaetospira]